MNKKHHPKHDTRNSGPNFSVVSSGTPQQSTKAYENNPRCEYQPSPPCKYEAPPMEKRKWGMTIFERVMAALTIIAILVASATGFIIWLQVDEMRTDERAWIGAIDPQISWDTAQGGITIKNYGKSPAKKVEHHTVLNFAGRDIPIPYEKVDETKHSKIHGVAVLVPNEPFPLVTDPPEENIDLASIRAAFENKTLEVRLLGKVTYIDIFDRPQSTKFCFIFRAEWPRPRMCPAGNEIE